MQPECACPLCGQQVAALPLTILPERGMVVAGGRFAVLTAHEMMVLERLAEVFPRGQSKEDLLGWIYQLRPDEEPEIKIIDVWICKIRRKVAPLGVRIDTMWGRGYALAVEERPTIVRPLETTRGEERGARPGSNKSGEPKTSSQRSSHVRLDRRERIAVAQIGCRRHDGQPDSPRDGRVVP